MVTVEAPGLGSPEHRQGGRVNRPVVVKLGGRSTVGERELADAVRRVDAPVVIAHGGGNKVTEWCQRLGIDPVFRDGLRVTDEPTLEVATAVLAGLANKRLVATLRAAGLDAVGLSALDGGIVTAEPHPDAAVLGHVGAVGASDGSLLRALIAAGRLPVVASIGDDGAGSLLNLNADDLAAALAGALGAELLVLLSDTPGVVLGGSVRRALDAEALDAALEDPGVRDGMRPKLRAAKAALERGVARVVVAAWDGPDTLARLVAHGGVGTTIAAAQAAPAEART
jgi:acetylglutamate kinase